MQLWVWFTCFAGGMQAVRTGLQKALTKKLDTMSVTWVRAGFGLPLALVYFWVLALLGFNVPSWNITFLLLCLAGSLAQIAGTALLVTLFAQRNFAVATIYHKTDALQAAIFGALLFGEFLNLVGFIAVIIGFIGLMFISFAAEKLSLKATLNGLTSQSALIGFGSGLGAALAGLCFRFASLSLQQNSPIMNASFTLVNALVMQTLLLGGYLFYKNRGCFNLIFACFKPSIMVGITSMLGSVGWFTALSMAEAAAVKTVGQIEMLFAVVISRKIFKEKISTLEFVGIALILFSIILLLRH